MNDEVHKRGVNERDRLEQKGLESEQIKTFETEPSYFARPFERSNLLSFHPPCFPSLLLDQTSGDFKYLWIHLCKVQEIKL